MLIIVNLCTSKIYRSSVCIVRVLQKSDKVSKVSANPLSEITRWIYKYEYSVILFYKIL